MIRCPECSELVKATQVGHCVHILPCKCGGKGWVYGYAEIVKLLKGNR